MASLPQAPFYVPRPSDDPTWQWVTPPSDTIRLLSFQKIFGAGGQVPTRRWAPFLVDEPAVTYQAAFQNGPVRVTLTQTKFYGQPGQVVTARWAPFYTQDDPAIWPRWMFRNNAMFQKPVVVLNWRGNGYDDAAFWQGSQRSSQTINPILTAAGQVKPRQWLFGLDDSALWSPALETLNSAVIQILDHAPFTKLWRYDFDDAALWAPALNNLNVPAAIRLQSNVQVLFYPPLWAPNPPDIQGWQFEPNRNGAALAPTGGKPAATAGQWNYHFDDAASWQWTPPNTIATQLGLNFISSVVVNYADDPANWQVQPARNNPILAATTPSPFIPLQWKFGLSAEEIWQPTRQRSIALPTAPFRSLKWTFTFTAAEEPWSPIVPRSVAIGMLGFKPFTPKYWNSYDDAAIWQQIPQRNDGILSITPKPVTPNFLAYQDYIDDPQGWLWTPPRSLLGVPLPLVKPPIRIVDWWSFVLDDSAVWWQQVPQRNVLYTLIPVFPGVPTLAYSSDRHVFAATALDLLGYAGLANDRGVFTVRASDSPSGQNWSGAGYMASYEIDTTIQINGEFRSSLTGVYIDPTTITLFVLDPSGLTTTYTYPGTIVRDALGHFHQQITPSKSGTWTYKWQALGAAVATSPDTTFTVNSSLLIAG